MLQLCCVWTGKFNQHPLLVVPAAQAEHDMTVEINAARDLNTSDKDTLDTKGSVPFAG